VPETAVEPLFSFAARGHVTGDGAPFLDPRSPMSESYPSGYGDSPDTSDGAVAAGAEQVEGADNDGSDAGPTLTTDDDAQRDESVARPGNDSD
jgi:hypothetical protein